VFSDEHVQLAQHLFMATEGEVAVDPVHQRRQPELVELGDLFTAVRFEQQTREGGTAPEGYHLTQDQGSRFGLSRGCPLAGGGKQLAEAPGVQLVEVDPEAVAAVCGLDRVVAVLSQRLAKLGDVDIDGLLRRRRGRRAPELVDQSLAGDELIRVQKQNRKDEPLLRPAQRDRLALVGHLERPEDPVLHQKVFTAFDAKTEAS
jgi:hypothetical protein